MAFTPPYAAQLIRPIRNNMLAFLRAREAESLTWANDGDAMQQYKVYQKSRWYNTLFPVLALVSVRTTILEAEDKSRIECTHELDLEIEDAGKDPDLIAESVERRLCAADMVIRTMTRFDILKGREPSTTGGPGAVILDVSPHDYSQFLREAEMIYKTRGSFTVTVGVIEMKTQT